MPKIKKKVESYATSSNRCRRARRKLGLTQRQMAEKLGVALITYQKWEQGQARPAKPEIVASLKEILKG